MLVGHIDVRRKSESDPGGIRHMQDWISDWKRWSRAERCFAIVLVILSLVIPLGFLIGGGRLGS
jgi:hypothetical protein